VQARDGDDVLDAMERQLRLRHSRSRGKKALGVSWLWSGGAYIRIFFLLFRELFFFEKAGGEEGEGGLAISVNSTSWGGPMAGDRGEVGGPFARTYDARAACEWKIASNPMAKSEREKSSTATFVKGYGISQYISFGRRRIAEKESALPDG
jgi:hypothetical protein